MLEAVSTPELAVEITLQPIRRFGFDAAILFSDLTVAFTPMGAPFDIREGVGPVIHDPVRCPSDVGRLREIEPEEDLDFVLEAVRLLKSELTVPLIGLDVYKRQVFTSANGVRAVAERMQTLEIPTQRMTSRKLAVVGPSTGEVVEAQWRAPDAMPAEFVAEAICLLYTSDRLVGEVCDKYNTKKWFSINKDIGTGSALEIPGF